MTLAEFKALNEAKGQFWFKPDTMKFWGSTVEYWSTSGYFITSENQFDKNLPKRFTIRKADFETGNVSTIGKFQAYSNLQDAREVMEELF